MILQDLLNYTPPEIVYFPDFHTPHFYLKNVSPFSIIFEHLTVLMLLSIWPVSSVSIHIILNFIIPCNYYGQISMYPYMPIAFFECTVFSQNSFLPTSLPPHIFSLPSKQRLIMMLASFKQLNGQKKFTQSQLLRCSIPKPILVVSYSFYKLAQVGACIPVTTVR